jgi:predicted ATP-grasp superfamily ATP-dependent carboligase
LQKEVGGAGGVHIRQAGDAPAGPRVYFQREARGQPMSATFLADGDRARLLGFNRLRVAALGEAAFCYAGAVAGAALAPALRRQVQLRLDRLVRVTGLRGLAGLDFLRDGELLTALEVNPRPTATFELYDDDFPEGLVHWHKLSFERSVPEFDARVVGQHGRCRALGVVYAPHPISIPRNAAFPAWCRDLPGHGSTIAAGAPVVSVFAEAANVELAEREIDARGRAVRALLKGWRGAEQRAVA